MITRRHTLYIADTSMALGNGWKVHATVAEQHVGPDQLVESICIALALRMSYKAHDLYINGNVRNAIVITI